MENNSLPNVFITGTHGAGKETLAQYLVQKYSYLHLRVREEIERQGKIKNISISDRPGMRTFANLQRHTHGGAYFVKSLFRHHVRDGHPLVIESVRAMDEVDYLKKLENVLFLGVDAPEDLRYERIKARGSDTDNISFKVFIEQEKAESSSPDPKVQNIQECLHYVDYRFWNGMSTIKEFEKMVECRLPALLHAGTIPV